MVRFFFEEVKPLDFKRRVLKKFIFDLLKKEGFICKDVNVVFCSDEYLLSLNEKFLKHHYYTDIITFNYNQGNYIAGELYISVDRLRENADRYKVIMLKEVFRVVIHGFLHLAGYADKKPEDKVIMKEKEDFYLDELFSIYR